jgi:hypothetical protein
MATCRRMGSRREVPRGVHPCMATSSSTARWSPRKIMHASAYATRGSMAKKLHASRASGTKPLAQLRKSRRDAGRHRLDFGRLVLRVHVPPPTFRAFERVMGQIFFILDTRVNRGQPQLGREKYERTDGARTFGSREFTLISHDGDFYIFRFIMT